VCVWGSLGQTCETQARPRHCAGLDPAGTQQPCPLGHCVPKPGTGSPPLGTALYLTLSFHPCLSVCLFVSLCRCLSLPLSHPIRFGVLVRRILQKVQPLALEQYSLPNHTGWLLCWGLHRTSWPESHDGCTYACAPRLTGECVHNTGRNGAGPVNSSSFGPETQL
jgi:hypothetical protein